MRTEKQQMEPEPPGEPAPSRPARRRSDLTVMTADLRRSEHRMFTVRWAATGFALLQVLAYDDRPYPDNVPVFTLALVTIGVLVSGNLLGRWGLQRARSPLAVRRVALSTLGLDVLVATSFVWLWAFDPDTALWAVLFILPLEGAIKFQLLGALGAWALSAALYTAREFWGSATYPDFTLQWNSITFRMGIGFLIALVAGYMARDLTQQRLLVEATLEDVRRVDRLRAGLVSTLAHDVRGPLTAIRTALTTLLKRGGTLDTGVTEELLSGAERQAARMEHLATDLLDLARLERGRLELSFQPVALADAVARALTYVEHGEDVAVRIEPELMVRADPGRLEQIVVNLVSNAVRHGEEPFAVEASPTNGRVVLAVTDQGSGIPEEEEATLFDPFRVEQRAGSVGFGLAVVRALAEAHGGDVRYRQNRPRGARFEVTIPLAGEPVS